MIQSWLPIIKEILLFIIAVFIFLVLYDCFHKKKTLKESLKERTIFLLFRDGLGWIIYLLIIIIVVFLVYSIFFE